MKITDVVTMDANTPALGVKTVALKPAQFHFHVDSEHALDGETMAGVMGGL